MKRLLGKKGIVALLAAVLVLSTAASLFLFPLLTSAEPGVDATAEGTWDGKPNIKWYLDNPDASEFEISTPADLLGLSYLVNACARTSRQPDASGKTSNTSDNFRKDRLPSECTDHFLYNADTGRLYVKEDETAREIPEDAATLNFDIKFWFTDKTLKLTADIDLEGKPWTPIGMYDGAPFQGTFDGGDHFVKNISINGDEVSIGSSGRKVVGFFGYMTSSATVKNLTLDQMNVTFTNLAGNNTHMGGLAGSFAAPYISNVTINNLTVTATANTGSPPRVGALVGYCNPENSKGYGATSNINHVKINGVTVNYSGSVELLSSAQNIFGSKKNGGGAGPTLEGYFFTDGCNNTVQANYVHEHVMTAVEKKDATCTEVGNEAYWVCRSADPNCVGVYYKSADGAERYANFEETVIKMKPHTSDLEPGKWHTDDDNHWLECSVCKQKYDQAAHKKKYEDGPQVGEGITAVSETHIVSCEDCDYSKEESHTAESDVWIKDEDGHHHTCKYCKADMDVGYHDPRVSEDIDYLTFETIEGNADYHRVICTICQFTFDEGEHSYMGAHPSYEKNETSHWMKCEYCGYEDTKEDHEWGDWQQTDDGKHYHVCNVCQYSSTPEAHTSNGVKTHENGTTHWENCSSCGAKMNETEHVLSYEKTDESQHKGTCECGYSVTGNHDDSGEWKSDATNHWKVCPVCSGEIDKADHTGDLKYAQNDDHTAHYQTCDECGYKSAETEHDKLILTDNGDYETHRVTCETCDLTVEEKAAHTWVWETDSNNPKYEIAKCACGAVKADRRLKHTHVPNKVEKKDPTCTEDGNIEYWICTAEDGECDGKYYTNEECTEEVTKKDTVLKATGHKLTETAAKDATCTAEGNTKYYTCDNCGKYFADDKGENEIEKDIWVTEKTEHVFASTEWSRDAEKHWHECANGCGTRSAEAAHTFEKGVCTVCGAADPNYVELDKYEDKTSGAVAEYTDPKADYDEEVVLTVEPVTEEKQEAKDALAAVEKAAKETFKDAAVYDVTLKNLTTGVEVQPDGQIKVTLKVPEGWETAVYRVEKDGSATDMKATMSADGKTVSFVTDHLSTYVLVNTKTSAPATADFILLPVAILLVGTVSGLGILRLRKKSAR